MYTAKVEIAPMGDSSDSRGFPEQIKTAPSSVLLLRWPRAYQSILGTTVALADSHHASGSGEATQG